MSRNEPRRALEREDPYGQAASSDDADPTTNDVVLELDGVTKVFGPECAVDELSLSVRDGELLTLLGPSGCGKTTTLRMLAGLERPDGGEVRLNDRVIADGDGRFRKPEHRDVGIVFQNFALFPHLTVAENVAFGLQDRDDAATAARVDELLDLVGLEAQRESKPAQLSGGQQQRVALARSLAPEPSVLLLDEPFSNLDVRLREQMREEVRAILKEAGVTAVSVTHDQEEALSISDRVAVMHDGDVEQAGTPEKVFQHPESRFVASFLGQASFLTGHFARGAVETALGDFPASMVEGLTTEYENAEVDLLVRPDDLRATPVESDAGGNGEIIYRQYMGPSFVYRVRLDSGDVVHCQHNHVTDFELGQRVNVELVADHTIAWYPTQ
ncbi:ABC transporter ATP-binding protein [Halorubellus sp. PRR65]|uniref:ABC transporter ATP-binding protein n=1 Tax=Halorubellus sp. PRR65 TaxID=3098148 RepID=UPI002B263172|nr:ABC transporter ATP-binding protein [Halorubellus sp. PRR65]